jgi:hypothetical protein
MLGLDFSLDQRKIRYMHVVKISNLGILSTVLSILEVIPTSNFIDEFVGYSTENFHFFVKVSAKLLFWSLELKVNFPCPSRFYMILIPILRPDILKTMPKHTARCPRFGIFLRLKIQRDSDYYP